MSARIAAFLLKVLSHLHNNLHTSLAISVGIVHGIAEALGKKAKIVYYDPTELGLKKGEGFPFRFLRNITHFSHFFAGRRISLPRPTRPKRNWDGLPGIPFSQMSKISVMPTLRAAASINPSISPSMTKFSKPSPRLSR